MMVHGVEGSGEMRGLWFTVLKAAERSRRKNRGERVSFGRAERLRDTGEQSLVE